MNIKKKEELTKDGFARPPKTTRDAGIYCWTLPGHDNDALIIVYVGRTSDISRRTEDYGRSFQPASPNDCKLKFFETWTSRPPGKLQLWFRPTNKAQLIEYEGTFIEKYTPFLNNMKLDRQDVEDIKKAYQKAYHIAFTRRHREKASS